jgi:hypothetical protein
LTQFAFLLNANIAERRTFQPIRAWGVEIVQDWETSEKKRGEEQQLRGYSVRAAKRRRCVENLIISQIVRWPPLIPSAPERQQAPTNPQVNLPIPLDFT